MDEAVEAVYGGDSGFNRYYRDVSAIYRTVEFLLLFALLAFLVLTAVFSRDEINYENFEYVVRNFAVKLDENEAAAPYVRYEPDGAQQFALLGEGLVECGESRLNLFTATGRQITSAVHGLFVPGAAASEKYVILYEKNGNNYAVYNLFNRVHEETLPHSVTGVCVSDNGSYAVITRTDEYNSAIFLYDRKFHRTFSVYRNGYVLCAAMNADGDLAAAVLSTDAGGSFSTELFLSRPGEEEPIFSLTVPEVFPLSLGFTESGLMLVSDRDTRFYSLTGEETGLYSYGDRTPSTFAVSENGVLLVFPEDAMGRTYTVEAAGTDGNVCYSRVLNLPLYDCVLDGTTARILTSDSVVSVNENGISYTTHAGAGMDDRILCVSPGRLYLCRSAGAELLTVD